MIINKFFICSHDLFIYFFIVFSSVASKENTIASFFDFIITDPRACFNSLVSPAFAFLCFIEARGGEGPGET